MYLMLVFPLIGYSSLSTMYCTNTYRETAYTRMIKESVELESFRLWLIWHFSQGSPTVALKNG